VFSVQGGNYEKLLNICLDNAFEISHVCANSLGFTAKLDARKYKSLCKIAKKCGCKIKAIKKKGIYFRLFPLRKRYGILVGLICFFILTAIMPKFVWKIDFYNIKPQDQKIILNLLQNVGIQAGMHENNDKIIVAQQQVLLKTPQYSWVAINYIRGKIVVEVENSTLKPNIIDNHPSYIVSGCDGIIYKMDVFEGTGLKTVGQCVSKDEVLVRGVSEGGLQVTQTRSRADIIAYVEKKYIVNQPLKYKEWQPTGNIAEHKTLCFLDYKIPLSSNKNFYDVAEKITYYKPVEIFGFALPLTLQIDREIELFENEINLTQEKAKMYAQDVLNKAMYNDLKNPEILSKEVEYCVINGNLTATMYITAYSDIGVLVEQ
ncbi:MAG: sporulation protein YqfD, partial [Oscillospiraceae bacterium]